MKGSLFVKLFLLIFCLALSFFPKLGASPTLQDSVKVVNINVFAKEIAVNYDSLFHAKLDEVNAGVTAYDPELAANINTTNSTGASNATSKKPERNLGYSENFENSENELAATETGEKPILPETSNSISNTSEVPVENSVETGVAAIEVIPDNAIPQQKSVSKKLKDTLSYTALSGAKLVYLWTGFILMLIGVIGGLVFNRNAFIVSGVGIAFLLIGLYV